MKDKKLNIPLFIIGWLFVGRRFFLYRIAGVVIFSADDAHRSVAK